MWMEPYNSKVSIQPTQREELRVPQTDEPTAAALFHFPAPAIFKSRKTIKKNLLTILSNQHACTGQFKKKIIFRS